MLEISTHGSSSRLYLVLVGQRELVVRSSRRIRQHEVLTVTALMNAFSESHTGLETSLLNRRDNDDLLVDSQTGLGCGFALCLPVVVYTTKYSVATLR
jgi:hypothetical protein